MTPMVFGVVWILLWLLAGVLCAMRTYSRRRRQRLPFVAVDCLFYLIIIVFWPVVLL